MKLQEERAGAQLENLFRRLRSRRGTSARDEEDERMARAVTAGAVAGAMAGAVAGATAAAATVQAERQSGSDAGCATPTRSPGAAAVPPLLDSPGYGEWQRAYDDSTKAWYYYSTRTRETTWTPPPGWVTHKASGSMAGEDLEMALAQTLTIDDYLHKSGLAQHLGEEEAHRPQAAVSPRSPPSLYARDTDIETQEEARALPPFVCAQGGRHAADAFAAAGGPPRR
jgi:hypothetical protein